MIANAFCKRVLTISGSQHFITVRAHVAESGAVTVLDAASTDMSGVDVLATHDRAGLERMLEQAGQSWAGLEQLLLARMAA